MNIKTCTECDKDKPLSEFNKKSANTDGHERYCKECHRIHNRAHYQANKQVYKNQAKKSRLAYVRWYKELKSTKVCEECGETKPWRLTFHHSDPSTKTEDVSAMIQRKRPKEIVLEEIDKCECLCHNCHSDRHHEDTY